MLAQCAVHTPLLGPDVKYAQLADIHTHAGAGECADQCMSYRTGVQPTLAIPDMQKVSTNHGSPDFAYTKSPHGLGGGWSNKMYSCHNNLQHFENMEDDLN